MYLFIFLVSLTSCFITLVFCNVMFYRKSGIGAMDMEWNEEDGVWNANLHIPTDVDYSKIEKLIVKINKK